MENFPYPFLSYIKLEEVKIEIKTEEHQPEELKRLIKTETDIKFEIYEQNENKVVKNGDVEIKFEEIKLESCDELKEPNYIEKAKENKIPTLNSSQSKWKCSVCSFECKTKDDLREHITSTHKDPSNSNLFICNLCHYTTRYLYELKYHEARHKKITIALPRQPNIPLDTIKQETSLEGEEQECGLCDFKSKNLAEHITTTHKNSGNMFKCNVCAYVTQYFHTLKCHMSSHNSSSNEKWYHCYKCNHRSKDKKQHMLKHTSMLGVYRCKSCDYRTKYKGQLATRKLKHKVEVFKCSVCDFHSKWKYSIVKHVARHVKNSEIV